MLNKEIWPFLFFVGLIFLNWPFLEIFKSCSPYYFFIVWALFILVVGVLSSRVARKKRGDDV